MQLVEGSENEHSVVDPEVKVTVPVAPVGRPDSANVAVVPKGMETLDAEFAVTENEVGAGCTDCSGLRLPLLGFALPSPV